MKKKKKSYIEHIHSLTPRNSREGRAARARRKKVKAEGQKRMEALMKEIYKFADENPPYHGQYEKAREASGAGGGVQKRKNPDYKKPKYGKALKGYESLLNY